jgi:hypothetical protein
MCASSLLWPDAEALLGAAVLLLQTSPCCLGMPGCQLHLLYTLHCNGPLFDYYWSQDCRLAAAAHTRAATRCSAHHCTCIANKVGSAAFQ